MQINQILVESMKIVKEVQHNKLIFKSSLISKIFEFRKYFKNEIFLVSVVFYLGKF